MAYYAIHYVCILITNVIPLVSPKMMIIHVLRQLFVSSFILQFPSIAPVKLTQ